MNKMKRIFFFLFLFLPVLANSQGYEELYDGDDASVLREYVAASSARKNEESLSEYISGAMSETGVDVFGSDSYTHFGIRRPQGDTVTFRNVVGGLAGYGKDVRNHYIVVGSRLSADNATGLAVLLRLAGKLCRSRELLRHSIIFAAFGGSSESDAGSWYFLNRAFTDVPQIDAYVGLDYFDNPNRGFFMYSGSNADMDRLAKRLQNTMQAAQPVICAQEPAQSDHRSFQALEIPSAFFTTSGPGTAYRTGIDPLEFDELSRQCEYLYNYVLALDAAPAPSYYPREIQEIPTVSFEDCDVKPSFLGVRNPSYFLAKWVYTYLRYPQYALDNGIQGSVLVEFVIDEKGHVGSVKAVRGPHSSLEDEAVRVVSASPDWKPGLVSGKPVRTELSLLVDFRLEKKKHKRK